jgi:hypothetical protein
MEWPEDGTDHAWFSFIHEYDNGCDNDKGETLNISCHYTNMEDSWGGLYLLGEPQCKSVHSCKLATKPCEIRGTPGKPQASSRNSVMLKCATDVAIYIYIYIQGGAEKR